MPGPPSYQPPQPGMDFIKWLVDNLKGCLRQVTGPGMSTMGSSVSFDPQGLFGASSKPDNWIWAKITGFKKMPRTAVLGGSQRQHPHRYVYSFKQVELYEECVDGAGLPITCDPKSQQTRQISFKVTGDMEGDHNWPENGSSSDKKWAFNLAEVNHFPEPKAFDSSTNAPLDGIYGDLWFIFGVAVNSNHYPSDFSAHPPSAGPGGTWSERSALIVQLHISTSVDGQELRWFSWPGVHVGECLG